MRIGLLALCLSLAGFGQALAQAPVAPFVITPPASQNTLAATTITLSASIGGTLPIFYQWRRNGVAITGETSPFLIFTTSLTAGQNSSFTTYDLVASNSAGSVTTNQAVIYVEKRTQTITFATPPAAVAAGGSVALSATASSGLPVSLAIVAGSGSISGTSVSGTGGAVVVRATQAGNNNYYAADPVERTVTFVAGMLSPFITTQPADQTALAGTSLSLQITAIGTPTPTYQWQKDGLPIAGATGAALTFPSLTLADAARYTVVASNLAGTSSATMQVTVRAAPTITTPPANQTITAGTPATFGVVAAAFPAPTYQWRRNGTAIAGATRDTYTIPIVITSLAGSYDVVVTNALGAVTSPSATLTVVTRDFSGTYLGRLAGTPGDAALYVRANGTAAFFAHLPSLSAAIAVPSVPLELSGSFSSPVNLIAANPRNVTLRGTVDEVTGRVSATIAELNATFEGTRAIPNAAGAASAGLYSAALVNSATGRGFVVIAPDGQFLLLTSAGTTADSARGTLRADGRLVATTVGQASVDLAITNGTLRGTVRTTGANATTGTILGAIDGVAGTEHLANLSVRAVTTPQAPMIVGFAISGTAGKQVLLRAAGPAIGRAPFNIVGALPDPTLQLFRVSTVIGQNNDWGNPAASAAAITAASTRVGAFPFLAGSADAALVTTLLPGVYTAQIGGGTGVVLAEIYEATETNEAPGSRRLVNTSTLGVIAPDFPIIAGFVITGSAPQRVLIRAAGPTLAAAPFNIPGTLANPQLTLYRGSTTVRTNDDWFRDPEAAAIRDAAANVRAFAFGNQSLDAAILAYLEPGAYTAVVGAPANASPDVATGIVLIEIYESNL